MAYIKSYPNQNYLIPPKITDLFSENHVCYLIQQIAEEMDYSEFDTKYAGPGHPAYHPRISLKLLLMAYVDGIRSSRKIAKNACENVVYIFLAEKTNPDFRTISFFRKANPNLVKDVFKKVNTFALEHGLIDLSQLMIDGTIIKADTNDKHVIDRKVLDKLDKHIDRWIDMGIATDEAEDKLYGDRGIHELPDDLKDPYKRRKIVKKMVDEINKAIKEGKKEKVKEVRDDIEDLKKFMDAKGIKLMSLTDKDARFMLNKKGKVELSYNAQLVVDKNGFILSNDVVNECDDRHQLVPNINHVEQDFGLLPKGTIVNADAGYDNGEALEELEARGFDLYVPGKNVDTQHDEKKKFAKANFKYDEEKDTYICPENQHLTNRGTNYYKPQNQWRTTYAISKRICDTCPNKITCCKKATSRSIITVPGDKIAYRIKEKLRTPEGKAIYKIRKQTVECRFGDVKENKKFRSFLLRGLQRVKTEWNLVTTASNLVIINNLLKGRIGIPAPQC